jgi:hypothetical protein
MVDGIDIDTLQPVGYTLQRTSDAAETCQTMIQSLRPTE